MGITVEPDNDRNNVDPIQTFLSKLVHLYGDKAFLDEDQFLQLSEAHFSQSPGKRKVLALLIQKGVPKYLLSWKGIDEGPTKASAEQVRDSLVIKLTDANLASKEALYWAVSALLSVLIGREDLYPATQDRGQPNNASADGSRPTVSHAPIENAYARNSPSSGEGVANTPPVTSTVPSKSNSGANSRNESNVNRKGNRAEELAQHVPSIASSKATPDSRASLGSERQRRPLNSESGSTQDNKANDFQKTANEGIALVKNNPALAKKLVKYSAIGIVGLGGAVVLTQGVSGFFNKKPPECGDEAVISTIKQMVTQQVEQFSVGDVLTLAKVVVGASKAANTITDAYDDKVNRFTCRTTLAFSYPPEVMNAMKSIGDKRPEPKSLGIEYFIHKTKEKDKDFLVEATIENITFLLNSVNAMQDSIRKARTLAKYQGIWTGTLSCPETTRVEPGQSSPPLAFVNPIQRKVRMEVKSVINGLNTLEVDPFMPQEIMGGGGGRMQSINHNWRVLLDHDFDLKPEEGVVYFSSHPDERSLRANLKGRLAGETIQATGEAMYTGGFGIVQKPCQLALQRQK